MRTLAKVRRDIESVDRELVDLVARRMALVEEACRAKTAAGKPIVDLARERSVRRRARDLARRRGLDPEAADQLFSLLIRVATEREEALIRGSMTYARAGVDIAARDRAVEALVAPVRTARKGLGRTLLDRHYAGVVDLPGPWGVALTTDGVGTKLLVASALETWDTVGIDCIAMNVNDLLCVGAEPVAFVDYLAVQRPDPTRAREIGEGLAAGAKLANVGLVGGETAVLPELIHDFDLAGTAMGFVRKSAIITGRTIRPGDAVVGIPSSGIHSNGLTLARRVLKMRGLGYGDPCPWDRGRTLGEELLEPTRIYVPEVLRLLKRCDVRGLAHITGSGLLKLRRLTGHGFRFDDPLEPPPVFDFLEMEGSIAPEEMHRTFNMGMGFVAVVPAKEADAAARACGKGAAVVGKVTREKRIWVKSLRVDSAPKSR
jgi:phosphoribosylformylglycinamidine cyclo-ligase